MTVAGESLDESVAVICEVASAHGGDPSRLIELLKAAANADADWVKLQIFSTERLVSRDSESYSLFKSIEISPQQWARIFDHAIGLQLRVIAEVFDMPSLEVAVSSGSVRAYKIPTADLGDTELVAAVCRQGKPVFIGIGGATTEEIDAIVEKVARHSDAELVLMHGFQNFPTRLEDSLLSRIPWLRDRYRCRVGFADHVDADDLEMARTVPAMAVVAGATVIEKHLTLDRAAKGFDYYSALNPEEFAQFVQHMRRVHAAIGKAANGELTPAEIAYRTKMKKFAVAEELISCGTVLRDARITYRRTSAAGLSRSEIAKFSDMRFNRDLQAGMTIEATHLEKR